MTKEKLRAYRSIKLEKDKLEEMIEYLEGSLYDPQAPRLDGMPRSGSAGRDSKTDALIDRVDKLRATYEARKAELVDALLEIENAIKELPYRERTLVRLYYAKGMTWEQVCVEMSYSWAQIHRIHAAALEMLKGGIG